MGKVERKTVDLSQYPDLVIRPGFAQFAPLVPARGRMFSARSRAGMVGSAPPAPVPETQT
jgi:hypothetical protein